MVVIPELNFCYRNTKGSCFWALFSRGMKATLENGARMKTIEFTLRRCWLTNQIIVWGKLKIVKM